MKEVRQKLEQLYKETYWYNEQKRLKEQENKDRLKQEKDKEWQHYLEVNHICFKEPVKY